MHKFDHKEIEKKWQDRWASENAFRTDQHSDKPKYYVLDMFPYPSGAGLHVGHPLGYFGTDIVARKRRMDGFEVLHPIGWDSFGLPAENYAIKTGVPPAESIAGNIANYRRQLCMLGLSYDWSREVSTSSPEYYKWTQWLFLLLYRKGLAYKATAPVNWCEKDQTVLANEQVVGGNCERCGNPVIQKELSQWFFKVTAYTERLLSGLEGIDWPEKIKLIQQNWIGKSEGAEIAFKGDGFEVNVFTTRPDTLFGVSYVVVAPEHPLVDKIVTPGQRAAVEDYRRAAAAKSELQRTGTEQDKSGVPTGATVRHPFTGADVPVWVADYVLASYGTGCVMGVPAHDERDFAFAAKYGLPVTRVIAGERSADDAAYTEAGTLVNSGEFDGLNSEDAKSRITESLEEQSLGRAVTKYRLRDWLVSRQRYWGAPIPIIHCDECGEQPVPEEQLPVLLPEDVDFRPTGESPLARSAQFHAGVKCPSCGRDARRESDTMDTFVDSSWYFLRYPSPRETASPFSAEAVKKWCPIDLYVGGAEHAVLHLLFSRFFTKVLFDEGLIGFDEPFVRLRNQGHIRGEDGRKMSKSLGNVVNPDAVVAEMGADTLRLYEMFMGDFADSKPWDTKGIQGTRRFLDRVWERVHDVVHERRTEVSHDLERALHRVIKKVGDDVEAFKFNTAVSAMMIFMNEWDKLGGGDRDFAGRFVRVLSPFAPHLCEELWQLLGNGASLAKEAWPTYDAALLRDATVSVVVQVGGKVRDRIELPSGADQAAAMAAAAASPKISALLEGRKVAKAIYVQDKLLNIVLE